MSNRARVGVYSSPVLGYPDHVYLCLRNISQCFPLMRSSSPLKDKAQSHPGDASRAGVIVCHILPGDAYLLVCCWLRLCCLQVKKFFQ